VLGADSRGAEGAEIEMPKALREEGNVEGCPTPQPTTEGLESVKSSPSWIRGGALIAHYDNTPLWIPAGTNNLIRMTLNARFI